MKPKFFLFALLSVVAFGFSSCEESLDWEALEKLDQIERDRETAELADTADASSVTVYKGLKIMMRSLPVDMEMDSAEMNQIGYKPQKHALLEGSTLNKITSKFFPEVAANREAQYAFSAYEYFKMFKKMLTLQGDIKGQDEDVYPTMLHVFSSGFHVYDKSQPQPTDFEWNETKEHLVLASVLMHCPDLPVSMAAYEMQKADLSKLEKDGFLPVAHITKGTLLMEMGYNYLAEEQFSLALVALENDGIDLTTISGNSLLGIPADADQQIKHAQAMVYGLRSAARYRAGASHKLIQANEDGKLCVDIVESEDIDNPLSWVAASGYYLNTGDFERAETYLSKLAASDVLAANEQVAVVKAQGYLKERDANSALNALYDNVFIAQLGAAYATDYRRDMAWYAKVIKSQAGRGVVGFPTLIQEETAMVIHLEEDGEKLIKEWNTAFENGIDDLELKGEELLEDGEELLHDIEGALSLDSLDLW